MAAGQHLDAAQVIDINDGHGNPKASAASNRSVRDQPVQEQSFGRREGRAGDVIDQTGLGTGKPIEASWAANEFQD